MKSSNIGGQAVMEGILMRNGGRYAVAVRRKDGKIFVERHGWFGLTRKGPLSRPFLRGFPLLVETLVNGVRALNRSAELSGEEDGEESPSAPEEQAAPEEAGGAMGQEPPTQPAEGAADAGIEIQPGALGQGQSQASSTTEQWVLLGGSFLTLGIGLAAAGLYHRKG